MYDRREQEEPIQQSEKNTNIKNNQSAICLSATALRGL